MIFRTALTILLLLAPAALSQRHLKVSKENSSDPSQARTLTEDSDGTKQVYVSVKPPEGSYTLDGYTIGGGHFGGSYGQIPPPTSSPCSTKSGKSGKSCKSGKSDKSDKSNKSFQIGKCGGKIVPPTFAIEDGEFVERLRGENMVSEAEENELRELIQKMGFANTANTAVVKRFDNSPFAVDIMKGGHFIGHCNANEYMKMFMKCALPPLTTYRRVVVADSGNRNLAPDNLALEMSADEYADNDLVNLPIGITRAVTRSGICDLLLGDGFGNGVMLRGGDDLHAAWFLNEGGYDVADLSIRKSSLEVLGKTGHYNDLDAQATIDGNTLHLYRLDL